MNLLDRIACKANYAAYVKKIMPPRRSRRGVLIMQFFSFADNYCY